MVKTVLFAATTVDSSFFKCIMELLNHNTIKCHIKCHIIYYWIKVMWIPAAKCYATVRLCNASARMHAFVHQVEQQKAMSQPDYASVWTYAFVHQQQKAMSQPGYVSACMHAFVDTLCCLQQCQWQVCMTTVIRQCVFIMFGLHWAVWATIWVQSVAIVHIYNINIFTPESEESVSIWQARRCQDNGTANIGNDCLLIKWTTTALILTYELT